MNRPDPKLLEMSTIHSVTTLDLVVDDWQWPFAHERRDQIDRYFAVQRAANPALWNGRVLLAREPRFHGDTFSARYFDTDFASFLAWRDWGFPDPTIVNGFGMGALQGGDGGFVMGEMAAHTSNAGRIYFPSGTPDLNDIRDGRVDIAASVAREVEEETGLMPSDYTAGNVWHCVPDGPSVAMIRLLNMASTAEDIRTRIENNLKTQTKAELHAAHVIRGVADITPAMQSYVATFIAAQTRAAT